MKLNIICENLGLNNLRIVSVLFLMIIFNFPIYSEDIHHLPDSTNNAMTLEELKSAGITMLTHCPYDEKLVEAANRIGIKIMPYVDLGKVVRSANDPSLLKNPFWKAVDADTNNHSEWINIDQNGKIRRPFDNENYHPGFDRCCNNSESLKDAQIAGIKKLMLSGCGGVFIDNSSPGGGNFNCYGDELNIHKHEYPQKSFAESYEESIHEIYKLVKSFGLDKNIIANTGAYPEQKGRCDFALLESLVYGVTKYRGKDDQWEQECWRSKVLYWSMLKNNIATYFLLQQDGIPRISFSFLLDPCTEDEAAFYSFVYTKILGLKLWSITSKGADPYGLLVRHDLIRNLYRIHDLGEPLSKVFFTKDYAYQAYEKAIIIINDSKNSINISIPINKNLLPAVELFTGNELKSVNDKITIALPPKSGRVIMNKNNVLGIYMTEVVTEAKTIRDYIDYELKIKNKEIISPTVIKSLDIVISDANSILEKLKNKEELDIDKINGLTLKIAEINTSEILRENGEAIVSQARNMTAEKIYSMLQLENDKPYIEIFRGGVKHDVIKPVIKTAKSAFIPFHYRSNVFFNMGEDQAFNLLTGPIATFGASGETFVGWGNRKIATLKIKTKSDMNIKDAYAIPIAFNKLEKIFDDGNLQKFEGELRLVGEKSKLEVNNYTAKIYFSVNNGSPFLHLDFSLLDKVGKKVEDASFMFYFSDTGYTSTESGSAILTKNPTKAQWGYFASSELDRNGIVVLGEPELNLTSQGIIGTGYIKCAVAPLSAREYYFIEERIRNLKLYSGRNASLANDIYLKLEASNNFTKGVENSFLLSINNDSGTKLKDVKWYPICMAINKKDRTIRSIPLKNNNDLLEAKFNFLIPEEFNKNDFVYIFASVEITLDGGKRFFINNFKSGRVKYPIETGDFTILEPLDNGGVKTGITLSSSINSNCKVKLTCDSSNVFVENPDMEFLLIRDVPKQIHFMVNTPNEKINEKVTGTITVTTDVGGVQEIPIEIKFSPKIEIAKVEGKPLLDGKLDDLIWEKIDFTAKNFLFYRNGEPVEEQTEVGICYTEKALYIGFRCFSSNISNLTAKALPDKTGYNVAALKDDSVEVYIRTNPEENSYIRIGGNCNAVKRADEFEGKWQMATSKHSDRWEVEIEIPFDMIGYIPKSGDVWGINFCRNIYPQTCTSWSYTEGTFDKPNYFGWARFK